MRASIILTIALVMMTGPVVDAWWKETLRTVATVAGPVVDSWGRRRIFRSFRRFARFLGKREVESDEFKKAAEDGVFTDEEIKSVFPDVDLTEFKKAYDMDENGTVTVEEYEMVSILATNLDQQDKA